jgi:Uncharacterized protein conserved in bacteria (DUF2188)
MPETKYVRENADGAWEVLSRGQVRSTVRAETKDKAVARAKRLLRSRGGGEVRVVNRSGKVVSSARVQRPMKHGRSQGARSGHRKAA